MRGNPFYTGDFSGGLNTRDGVYELEPNQARDLLNVLGTTHGSVRKREGSTLLATTASALGSLFAVEATSTKYLIGQGGTAFYRIDVAGTVSTITGSTTPTAGNPWAMVQAATSGGQGPVYMMNGVDTPQQWTGSGNVANWTAASGTLPNGRYMAFIGNRVFVAGMSSYTTVTDPGSTLVFSDIGDPRSWPVQNVVQFEPNDGDQITGLGTVGPYLLVFKRRKVFVVYDLDSGANRRLSNNTGCIAPRSIVETPKGTAFLSLDRGVYITKGSDLQLISDIIAPTLDSISPAQRANAAGAFHNDHYYLSVGISSSSQNDTTLDFDFTLSSWWKHSFAASQFAVWRASNSQQIYSAAAGAARVDNLLVANTYSDNGSGYQAYWTGPWQSPAYFRRRIIQTPDHRKRLRQVRFDASGKLSLYLARDFAASSSFVKSFDFTGSPTTFGGGDSFGGGGKYGDLVSVAQGRVYSLGFARAYSLQWLSDATSTSPWELENYLLLMEERTD